MFGLKNKTYLNCHHLETCCYLGKTPTRLSTVWMDSAPSVLDEVLGDSLLSCSLPHAAPVEVRPELAMLDYLRDLPLRSDFQTLIMANCAPVDRYFIPLCIRFYTSQVVQDFLNQQYHLQVQLYQHRPQIAKTKFCVINVGNSVTFARSSRQSSLPFSWVSGWNWWPWK